jgi:hypothetical protein
MMNIDRRRGLASVVVVGSCRTAFQDSRRRIRGANASISVTDNFDVEEVSNRVALRRFVGVDVDGMSAGREDLRVEFLARRSYS